MGMWLFLFERLHEEIMRTKNNNEEMDCLGSSLTDYFINEL